ncbi:MAG: phosphate ABC transporter substrate-binding protein PstS family protein [Nitriliruptorales bacterium]|nr:phosphate ABC transporter substrate-binding protein PstS family protein [Nitriliruptorales bacterium]
MPFMRRKRFSLPALLAVLALFSASCGGDGTSADAAGDESGGEVIVSGSSTVEPISARNAEKFAEDNPNVAISVDGPGTGDGFEIFCNGESDVSDASRAIAPEEIEACEANGIEFIELRVAIDGLSVITSTQNDMVECLSFGDLYALLGPESTGFDTWAAANDVAADVGENHGALNTPYPDAPLVVSAPGEESGTFDSFVEIALEAIAEERGQEPVTRPDYQASPNDNVIVEAIAGTPTSLGWVGYAFVQANPDAVRALAVDGGDGCVEPTPETIADGSFPIARPLFIYVDPARVEQKPELEAYIDFSMSDEGFASVSEAGYVDLEDDEIEQTRSVWESRETGTREG